MGGDGPRECVLVVDDDPDHLFMLEAVLERLGYEVMTALSCAAGRAALQERHVDALIADLSLVDGTALDLLEGLDASHRPRVALVLSGFDTEEAVERSLRAGFAAHLVKPIAIDQLRDALVRGARRGPTRGIVRARSEQPPASRPRRSAR